MILLDAIDTIKYGQETQYFYIYDTLKLLARQIRGYVASVEQVNADFMMKFMDVVPFDLSSITHPPSPGAPRPPSPPAPRPSPPASPHPPTRPVSPASPSVSEGHMSTLTSLTGQVPPVSTLMLGCAPTSRA